MVRRYKNEYGGENLQEFCIKEKVSYFIPNARSIEGVVSVGANNRHRHPNAAVMGKIGRFLQPNIEMTMTHGDIVKVL